MTDNPSRRRKAEGYEPRFDLDFAYGEQGELFVGDIANAIQNGAVEIKRDAQWHKTKRVYVEYECRKFGGEWEKSGIATTDAPLYAFVLGDTETALFIPTELLRELCRELVRRDVRAGRDFYRKACTVGSHPTKGIVVPFDVLLDWLTRKQHQIDRGEAT